MTSQTHSSQDPHLDGSFNDAVDVETAEEGGENYQDNVTTLVANEAGDMVPFNTLTPQEKKRLKAAVNTHLDSIYASIIQLSRGIVTHHKAEVLQRQLLGAVSGDHADRFQVDDKHVLGVGSFGVVYRGVDLASGQFVAVKVAKVGALVPHVARQLSEEFVKLRDIADTHIVKTLDFSICRKTGTAQLFMEWMAGGSVTTLMSNLGAGLPLPTPTIRRYMKHSLDGLQYLYEHNVVHKDIKPSNMLVNEDGHLKLGDLGSASMLGAVTSSRGEKGEGAQSTTVPELVGTPAYMAPECVQEGEYSADSDIWSWACSVLEMASGRPPWSHIPADQQKACATMFHVGTAPHRDASLRATLSPECIAILEQPPDCSEGGPTGPATPIANYFSEEHHKAANGVVYPLIPDTVPQPLVEILTWCFRVDPSLRPTPELLLGTLIVRNALA